MFCDGMARRVAQLSAPMMFAALVGCGAGTKVTTPTVEHGDTKVGQATVEVAPENKQTPENKKAPENKQALENKQKEAPKGCPRCQRIADRLVQNESVLSDSTIDKEWKAIILREMHFLNQQRERCWKDSCGATVSQQGATGDAASRTFSSGSSASR